MFLGRFALPRSLSRARLQTTRLKGTQTRVRVGVCQRGPRTTRGRITTEGLDPKWCTTVYLSPCEVWATYRYTRARALPRKHVRYGSPVCLFRDFRGDLRPCHGLPLRPLLSDRGVLCDVSLLFRWMSTTVEILQGEWRTQALSGKFPSERRRL